MGADRREPILNAAPSRMHQWIVGNVVLALGFRERELNNGFAEQRIRSLDKAIELRSLGISLPVAEIYRETGLV